jgi:hypothetical protein
MQLNSRSAGRDFCSVLLAGGAHADPPFTYSEAEYSALYGLARDIRFAVENADEGCLRVRKELSDSKRQNLRIRQPA